MKLRGVLGEALEHTSFLSGNLRRSTTRGLKGTRKKNVELGRTRGQRGRVEDRGRSGKQGEIKKNEDPKEVRAACRRRLFD